MTDLEATPITPEPIEDEGTVFTYLADYAQAVERVQQLEQWLESDPQYKDLQAERVRISELEDKIKKDMKESSCTNYENAGWEAVMVVRHGAPAVTYDIKHIEEEPWGSACVVKAVDAKVFNAIIKAKGLEADIELYCQTEPGKESKAVTIRPIVVKVV